MIRLLLWSLFLSFNISYVVHCHVKVRTDYKPSGETPCRGRYTRDRTFQRNFEIVVPRKVRSDGGFISHRIPHHYKRSYYKGKKRDELTPDDALHYIVSIKGKDHHLELYPNHRLIGPGAILEKRTAPLQNSSRDSRNYDFLDDTKFQKLRDTQCHYQGRVRDHRDVSALSTCYGLAGYIRTKDSLYMIEPVENHDFNIEAKHPHIVYRRRRGDFGEKPGVLCHASGNLVRSIGNGSRESGKRNPRKIENRAYTIELLAVLDKSFLDYYQHLDVENYVLTLFNMAAGLFQDVSLGVEMELVIVRIIRLEVEEAEMNIAVNKDPEGTLKHFQEWQKKMNPGDDTHPNHHDCAILMTKTGICLTQYLCVFTGISTIAGTCDPLKGAAVIRDNGLQTGYEIAHHLGHTIGMSHDVADENGCPGIITRRNGYIETTVMYPGYHYVTQRWSKCSKSYVELYIEAGLARCLRDEAKDHNFRSIEMLPGVMYSGDDQCRFRYRADARQCDSGVTCDTLKCRVPGMGCISDKKPPAEGTTCGDKRWCYQMECLPMGDRPSAIDGGWNSWSPWSHCSRTCGSGVAFSQRKCNHPPPTKGGEYCRGEWRRHKICATEPCEIGAPSFRDVQCSEFNDWTFPEDGKVHQWIGFNLPESLKASENPCVLYCLSETKLLTSLKTKVVDGTTCYRGIRDICVGGKCREIPCDLNMESDAIEDMCGVCRGDSTSCVLKEGVANVMEQQRLKKIMDVPVGAKNIKVEESQPSTSRIVVRSKKTKTVLIDGNRLGMFDVPGSKAWLGMIRAKQEALNIPGPVTEDLIIMVYPRENTTLKYSMGLKPKEPRKPSFEWGFIKWSRCSAPCGPGEQVTKPSCIEKIGGQVDDKFCKNIAKPEVKVRPCNQAPCVPRWMIGDWQGCVPCTASCKKIRAVKCIRPVGHGEQEADVIADSYCQGPKPKESESEACREVRESEPSIDSYESRSNEVEVGEERSRSSAIDSSKSAPRLLSKRSGLNNDDRTKNRGLNELAKGGAMMLKSKGKKEGVERKKGDEVPENWQINAKSLKRENDVNSMKKSLESHDSNHKRTGQKGDEPHGITSVKKHQVIIDKEDIKNLTLTILLERDDRNAVMNFPKDFHPQPPSNGTEFTLTGMDAVKYIQRIQEEAKRFPEGSRV